MDVAYACGCCVCARAGLWAGLCMSGLALVRFCVLLRVRMWTRRELHSHAYCIDPHKKTFIHTW